MKGFVKVITAGGVILGIGIAVFVIALGLNGWSFVPEFEEKTFTAENVNTAIDIDVDAGNLKTEFYDGDRIEITYPVANGYTSTITENEGGTLKMVVNKHHWFTFTWGATIPDTIIKLPIGTAYKVTVRLNAGSVILADGEYADITAHVNAGMFKTNAITGQNFKVTVNAGLADIGDITCTKLFCEVNAGRVETDKITCPDTEIKVAAGAAVLGFAGNRQEYDAVVDVSAGSCTGLETQSGTGGKKIKVSVSAGSAAVSFSG